MTRFRVALSFSGRKRDYVARAARLLAERFGEDAILYDEFHEAEFARSDLGFHLPDLYRKESDLVVVVICADYERTEWCGLEWRAIFELVKAGKDELVMLCRFDRASVEGLYSTSNFLNLDEKSPEQLTTRILERLALNEGKHRDFYLNAPPRARPGTVEELYNQALRCLSDGDHDQALALLNDAIRLNPSFSYAFYNRGVAYSFKSDDDRAIEDFDRALALGFENALLYRNRAVAFSRKGDVRASLADYARAIELDPTNPLAYLNRGKVHESTLRNELAIQDYQTVLDLVTDPETERLARERLLRLGVKPKKRRGG